MQPLWRGRVAVPTYIQEILAQEIADAIYHGQKPPAPPLTVVRAKFNPNLTFSWFIGVMHIVNDITLLAMFLRGAAVIREREHGTLEHLLAMPLRPSEIMLAKAWANGLVIVAAAMLSLLFVVIWLLRVPIAGSAVLFAGGVVIYLFSVTSLGILIATLVGWFDAAVRTSGAPNLHHHEFSVRWYDADAANGLACFIFRFLRRPHVHVVARIFGHV